METFSGLPAHPLFVHAPVVLMPLLMLATLPLAVRPEWRKRYGPALAIGAFVVLVATILAVSSGEAFEELAGGAIDVEKHEELAEATRIIVFLFFAGTVFVAFLDRFKRDQPPTWAAPLNRVAMGVTALVAMAASFWMYRTGHEGARLVWDGTVPLDTIRVLSLVLPWGR